jgi:hypothetical protein
LLGSPLVGVQRLHARYPARSASEGELKNSTFDRVGRREEHDGRQKMRVECTAYTNRPSNLRSRRWTACQAIDLSGRAEFIP